MHCFSYCMSIDIQINRNSINTDYFDYQNTSFFYILFYNMIDSIVFIRNRIVKQSFFSSSSVLGFITEKEEQPDQMSQQGLSAGDSWSSATSLDRFIPPTITRSLLSNYRYRPGDRVQFQVEYHSPSVQCHCTWQVKYLNDVASQPVQDGSIVNTNYSSILTIESIKPELQGLYTFNVENVYGRATTQTQVTVDQDHHDDEQLGKSKSLIFVYFIG